jgi:hypothetical protein
MIADIANVQIPLGPKLDAVRLFELRFDRRPPIAGIARTTRPCDRGDSHRGKFHFADRMVLHIDDVQIPRRIETDFMGQVHGRFERRSTIPGVPFLPGPDDGLEGSIGMDLAYALARIFAKPNISVWTSHDPKRIIELRTEGRTLFSLGSCDSRPSDILDSPNSCRLGLNSAGQARGKAQPKIGRRKPSIDPVGRMLLRHL